MSNTFSDRPSLAERYDDESRATLAARLRVCCWLAIILVPVFVTLDRVLDPELVDVFLTIRLTMVATSVAVLAALRSHNGARLVRSLSMAAFLQTGIGIAIMTAFNGGGSSPYYAGLNLVMLAAAVLMPWQLEVSAVCCTALVATYGICCAEWGGIPDARLFTANLFFLCSTAAITMVSHGVGERARRREFLQRVALEEAGRHHEEFLANVGHELRTPLSAIFGYCEMLADYTPNATSEQRGWLARVHQNASTLYQLIVQILDFSNIEAGALHLAREHVALDTVVTKVADDLRGQADSPGVEVEVDLGDESATVIGDAARVEEILAHLGANALKFAAGRAIVLKLGRGTLAGDPPWDRVVPEPGPDALRRRYLEVAIVDRGNGLDREDVRRLFVAFQQLDGSSKRRHEGTGLGLALSARLAGAMQAHIAVRSTPGVGSTFGLLIPAAEDGMATAGGEPVAASAEDQPALAVLVAGR